MIRFRVFSFGLLFFATTILHAQTIPAEDARIKEIRHLDLKYSFAEYESKEAWTARAEHLKKQILSSAGLWPMPEKTPLNAVIFGKIDRGDHTVEKVRFESLPGHFVTGNLYRPKNATGKLPAVLNPHGHWTFGRLENQQLNSGPARAATFARQGYVAFAWDMVGYNDSTAISHRFAIGHRNGFDRNTLWSVNLLGLQLWNSIRAIDFLLTLPEVDPERIACTGESGGGTQTFLIAAVDDRIKLASPVNMISFIMQGGSLCENAPNLRIDTNNVEIGALMAPRPMMMVSATGDWTRNTLIEEYPAIRGIYKLFGADEKLTAIQIDAPHNYNQPSREAVYGWFAHWFLGRPETTPIRERGGAVATLSELLVFFGNRRPENELNEEQLAESMIRRARQQLDDAFPTDQAGLEMYRGEFGATFRNSLLAEYPESVISENAGEAGQQNRGIRQVRLSRPGRGDIVPVTLRAASDKKSLKSTVMLVSPDPNSVETSRLAEALISAGHSIALVQVFPGGRKVPAEYNFFTTYNRTDAALRVQDILTAAAWLKREFPGHRLSLVGTGEAGLWTLLARGLMPDVDRAIVDADGFRASVDEEFVRRLAIPGIRRAGDFVTAVAIAPFSRLAIHNTGGHFPTHRIRDLYAVFGKPDDLDFKPTRLSDAEIIAWLR